MKTLLTIVLLLLLPFSVAAQVRLYQGGTGYATSTQGDLLVGTSSALRYSQLPIGANGRVLQVDTSVPTLMSWVATSSLGISGVTDHSLLSNLSWVSSGHTGTAFNLAGFDSLGAATNYATSALNILISDTVGTLLVPRGGTGATSLTGLLQGNGTSPFTAISNSSTVGQILRVTGASTYAWGALDLTDGDAITGALGQSNGGSGSSSAWGAGVLAWILSPTATNLQTAVSGTTGTAGSLVFSGSPTLTTPVIGDFTSSTHTHQNVAGGGTLDHGLALTGLTDDDHTQYQKETDFTSGSVLFRGSSVIDQDNTNLFWDDTNNRLGIGTVSPNNRLSVSHSNTTVGLTSATALASYTNTDTTNGNTSFFAFRGADTGGSTFAVAKLGAEIKTHAVGFVSGDLVFQAGANSAPTEGLRITASSTVGVNESAPASTLEINSPSGTTTIQALSTTASVGSRIILEDTDGAGCTEITALNGVLTAAIVTCL